MTPLRVYASAATLAVLAGCSGVEPEVDPREYLKGNVIIGINHAIPGWSEYVNGARSGFDVKLAEWLGEEIGFTPQFVNVTTAERMDKLVDRKSGVKLVVANFSITDERRAKIDFVGPYFNDQQSFLTRADANLTGLEQINGKRVCFTLGSTSQIRTEEKKIGQITVIGVPEYTHQACMDRLRTKDVDAFTSDLVILESFALRDPQNLRITGRPFGKELYGIGIPNNRPKLCEFLTPWIERFINRAWDDKFREAWPSGMSDANRKPSSDLPSCEQPT